ncbi:uncharacterized protein [Aristolochia californica]|uniref:uncharacterized protein isoform X2 n=1 Tax=Aristolochia californica TaxID=171875 RepID=UPI0035D68F71
MACLRRYLRPLTASLFPPSKPRLLFTLTDSPVEKCEPFKGWKKCLEPIFQNQLARFQPHLSSQRKYLHNFSSSGLKKFCSVCQSCEQPARRICSVGSFLGIFIATGNREICHKAYALNGNAVLVDEDKRNFWDTSGLDDDPDSIHQVIRKIWLPLILALTFCKSGDHPLYLLVKFAIYLLCTKPSPMSVYIIIEQLRRRAIRRNPGFYSYKPLFAKKVEVKNYMLLCWAEVELIDRKITLIGILGGWWILQSSTWSRGEIVET